MLVWALDHQHVTSPAASSTNLCVIVVDGMPNQGVYYCNNVVMYVRVNCKDISWNQKVFECVPKQFKVHVG